MPPVPTEFVEQFEVKCPRQMEVRHKEALKVTIRKHTPVIEVKSSFDCFVIKVDLRKLEGTNRHEALNNLKSSINGEVAQKVKQTYVRMM